MGGFIGSFKGNYKFLSNFHWFQHRLLGHTTVEHMYQAAKAITFQDAQKIMLATTPGKAKRLGSRIPIRPDWESIKVSIMRECLEYKFSVPELMEQLKNTEDFTLVEGNTWHDNFWGDCICPRCESIPGENMLGKLLMSIRGL